MEKYKLDENNGLWYELQGDYYLPCLKLPHVLCMEFPELPLGGNYEPDTFKLYFADIFERIF